MTVESSIAAVPDDGEPILFSKPTEFERWARKASCTRLQLELDGDVALTTSFAKLFPRLTTLIVFGGRVGPTVLRHPKLEEVYIEGAEIQTPSTLRLAGTARAGGARLGRVTLVDCRLDAQEIAFGPAARLVRWDSSFKGKPTSGTVPRYRFKGCARLSVIVVRCAVPYAVHLEGELPLLKKLQLTRKDAATLHTDELSGASPYAAKQISRAAPTRPTTSPREVVKVVKRFGFKVRDKDGVWHVAPVQQGSKSHRWNMVVSDVPAAELAALGKVHLTLTRPTARHLEALCAAPDGLMLHGLALEQLDKVDIAPVVKRFPELRALRVEYHFGGAELGALEDLTGLRDLRVQSTLKDVGWIGALTQLVRLDLSQCTRLRVLPSLQGLSALRELDLSNCDRLEDLGDLEAIVPRLEKLSLWRVSDPRAEELERMFRKQRRARKKG